jgi:(2R)-sulfolactate sulfo-lyase subunit beta
VQWASELRREERPLKDLWVSTKCGESDTTSGCGANPTVGNAFDKLYPHGTTLVFGETSELTGGEHAGGRALPQRRSARRSSCSCSTATRT